MADNKNKGNGGQQQGQSHNQGGQGQTHNQGQGQSHNQGQGQSHNQGQGQNSGSSTMQQAMSKAGDTARNLAGQARDMAGNAASAVKDQAEHAGTAVGSGMENLAGTLRENLPRQGMLGSVGSTVADSLETGGHYLQEHGIGDMADDLTQVVRKHPIPAMLVCVGIGFCLGQLLSPSRS